MSFEKNNTSHYNVLRFPSDERNSSKVLEKQRKDDVKAKHDTDEDFLSGLISLY